MYDVDGFVVADVDCVDVGVYVGCDVDVEVNVDINIDEMVLLVS